MILADKIIELRKQAGMSQEELADKLGVSRQSVSKWEMAQSTPDMNRIIMMAKLFGVSTDFLLLDEMESSGSFIPEENLYDEEDRLPRRSVSMEEANYYISERFRFAGRIALGVFLCIICPIMVIILGVGQETGTLPLTENQAIGLGCIYLFACVITAVVLFVVNGLRIHQFECYEKEELDTAYGVDGMVRERRERFRNLFVRDMALGIGLCVASVMPIFAGLVLFGEEDMTMALCTALLLLLIATGVFLIVRSAIIWDSFKILLQEEDYSPRGKLENAKNTPFAGIYWGVVTALFLGYSFITNNWDRSWIIWPVAGVCFGVVMAVIGMVRKRG